MYPDAPGRTRRSRRLTDAMRSPAVRRGLAKGRFLFHLPARSSGSGKRSER